MIAIIPSPFTPADLPVPISAAASANTTQGFSPIDCPLKIQSRQELYCNRFALLPIITMLVVGLKAAYRMDQSPGRP